ncbi:hypothetical protein M0812_05857 [Anaeramoeba flamelloides]|uniref:Uncharacterized protein n=1 Tax=Anaeramoeba flamelloides TaxID=1746091 RepID=A0AAV8AA52_9EUKA|nr:hypothetical protein M0812_05857 [Anaeramoeba flamelloides]
MQRRQKLISRRLQDLKFESFMYKKEVVKETEKFVSCGKRIKHNLRRLYTEIQETEILLRNTLDHSKKTFFLIQSSSYYHKMNSMNSKKNNRKNKKTNIIQIKQNKCKKSRENKKQNNSIVHYSINLKKNTHKNKNHNSNVKNNNNNNKCKNNNTCHNKNLNHNSLLFLMNSQIIKPIMEVSSNSKKEFLTKKWINFQFNILPFLKNQEFKDKREFSRNIVETIMSNLLSKPEETQNPQKISKFKKLLYNQGIILQSHKNQEMEN